MRTLSLILVLIGAGATANGLRAQMVAATPPVGFFKMTAQGGSDSVLSVPLLKPTALMAPVSAVTANTITLQTVTALTDSAFAPSSSGSYYAQFVTGKLAGLTYGVTGNTAAGVFTLATNGDDLTNHLLGTIVTGANGDVVRIRPYWTLADVFGTAASLLLDPSATVPTENYLAGDQVLFFDNAGSGTDKKLTPAFAYVAGTGWRQRGDATTDASGTPLQPGVPFVVRRQNLSAATLVVVGYTSPGQLLVPLPALAAGEDRDVAVALGSPAQPTLGASNLVATAPFGAVEISTDTLNLRDLLLEFTTDHHGFAVPAAHRYAYTGADWFEDDTNADAHALQPGSGYVLRLRGPHAARYWQQPSSP